MKLKRENKVMMRIYVIVDGEVVPMTAQVGKGCVWINDNETLPEKSLNEDGIHFTDLTLAIAQRDKNFSKEQ